MSYDVKEVIKTLEESALSNVEDVRFIKKMEIGQVVRQGDIYAIMTSQEHPHGGLASDNKLAVGTSKGSRHIAESPAVCYVGTTLPDFCADTAFMGPCVVSKERFTISHPSHANVVLPAGTYQILHQMNASKLARVRD